MIVYLAGGMRSDWQDKVQEAVPSLDYINPQDNGTDFAKEYTLWDNLGVSRCDLLFAYLEKDNPSGIGLAYEIGRAIALGKPVILVDAQRTKYTAILRAAADITYADLQHGIQQLKRMARMERRIKRVRHV